MTTTLDRERQQFLADPNNRRAFQELEEDLFLAGEWDALIEVYEGRLAANDIADQPGELAAIHYRVGEVHQDRRRNPELAAASYREAVRADPQFRPALERLRRLHSAQGQWEVALQIAEAESALPLRPVDRARLLTEMGSIWLDQLDEPQEALANFERALAEDPDQVEALQGSARIHQAAGAAGSAIAAWDRAIELLRGPARAGALIARAQLAETATGQSGQAVEYYRRALTDDPNNADALEAVAAQARADSKWALFADLQERRFELASEPSQRAEIALETGQVQSRQLSNPQAAQLWFERAAELDPHSRAAAEALADTAREKGDDDTLVAQLEQLAELTEDPVPTSLLLELATLHCDRGDPERAREELTAAFELSPGDTLVTEALADVLTRLGRDEELVEMLEQRAAVTTLDAPSRAIILFELASILEERLDDVAAAGDAYRRAFEMDPSTPGVASALDRSYRKAEDWDALRSFLESTTASAPPSERPGHLCSLATLLNDHFEDATQAVALLEEALEIEPDSATALRGLQHVAATSGDDDAVLAAYQREAEVTRDPSRLSCLIAELVPRLEARDQLEDALQWVQQWIATAPDDPQCWMTSAQLRKRLGQDSEVVADLERLDPLVEDAERAELRRQLGALHADHGRSDQAVAAYESALEGDPGDTASLEALAALFEREGKLDDLASTWQRLARLLTPPGRVECLDGLARLQADRLGNLDAAIETLGCLAAEADAPLDVDDRLAALLERTARFEELALHLGERIASLDPTLSETHALALRRADILLEYLDRCDEAAEVFREIRDRDPDSETACNGLEKALRASSDPAPLAEFLAERIESTSVQELRDGARYERAVLLEERLDRPEEAAELFQLLGASARDESLRSQASLRLEALLERRCDWDGLRRHLEASLELDDSEADAAIYERLGFLYRDRLGNLPRATDQFEAATTIAPERGDWWRALADLYEQEGRIDDLVTALEAESATGPEPGRELTLRSRAGALCKDVLDDRERAFEHFKRALELDPTHSGAADFLIEHWTRHGEPSAVVRLLEDRLTALREVDEPERSALCTSLRLQIANLRATELDDLDGAIASLRPALDEIGPQPHVAEPLANLFERAGQDDALIELCPAAAAACSETSARARWFTRLGDALCRTGSHREAANAYRSVLTDRPDDRHAQAILRDLYRRLGETDSLARLLEVELSHVAGREEIPIRLELAELLTSQPERRRDALVQLRRVLQLDADHREALDLGLDLAEALRREGEDDTGAEALLELLNSALAQSQTAQDRAARLTQRAGLTAGLGRHDEAVADFRESLALDPGGEEALAALRNLFESLGRWEAALDCVYQQMRAADAAGRVGRLREGLEIARERLGNDASLAWLQRLRCECPEDAELNGQIAEVHRLAGRREATLRALDAQIALLDDPVRRHSLHLQRARLLQEHPGSEARAAAALEDARRDAPAEPEILRSLADLYGQLGRDGEKAKALEALSPIVPPEERARHLQELARLYRGPLADPQRAAARLLWAIAEVPAQTPQHSELVRELGLSLRDSRDTISWASCAEEELRDLDPEAPVFEDRRIELHRELARAYEFDLGRPDAALVHLRALADSGNDQFGTAGATTAAENKLLQLLRLQGNWVELEARFTTQLERWPDDPQGWLELGRVRDEQLHETSAAAAAYREVLQREPGSIPALRGLRSAAERLGDWSEVAQTLEQELAHAAPEAATARAALLRCVGDVCWRRLQSTTRASRSYAGALEADPTDFESLRSLQQLLEAMEDWRGALDLYESEVEMLGTAEPERRYMVSLRAAKLARNHADDIDRAVRNYENAASVAALPTAWLRELAEIHEQAGDQESFARVFESWCDDPKASADCLDYVRLAEQLEALGRQDAARKRIEQALEISAEHCSAWDTAARLRELTGDKSSAAEALSIAADLSDDRAACARLVRAAELTAGSAPEQSAERLRAALRRDSANPEAHARLARLAIELGEFQDAELAAEHALELSSVPGQLEETWRLSAALAGGRAAGELKHLDNAVRFFGAAVTISPRDADALARYGEALAAQGKLEAARSVLESRLALDDPNPARTTHLSIIARAQWEADERDAAVETLESALRQDPQLDELHETLISLWESAGRVEEGVACLARWADTATDQGLRAQRLLKAAEWELQTGGRRDAAERHLRGVLDADPSSLRAWEALTFLLWDAKRVEEALQVASLAVTGVEGARSSPILSLVQGRALDQLGERAEAAEAFLAAAQADPSCVEAALSHARLLRGLGDWRAAADTLREFQERHAGTDIVGLSTVLQELGRLLAGPLEDPEGAIAAYRRAVTLDPERVETHASLAEFLSHRAAHRATDWDEALAHHQFVLNAEPVHAGSLRVLLRLARERNRPQAIATGLGIVTALGIASPTDLEEAARMATPRFSGIRELSRPLWESLRRIVSESAHEIAIALDAPHPATIDASEDLVAAFRAATITTESQLTAWALLPLTSNELGEVVRLIAALVLDPEQARGDGKLVNAISAALKKRQRRRLRAHLKESSMVAIDRIDFAAWRAEVRAIARVAAVDETDIDLRTALAALAENSSESSAHEILAARDMSPWVAADPEASALLRQAIRGWLSQL